MSYYRRNKFGVRTDDKGLEERTADNIVFASKREKIRYLELKILERSQIIRDLVLQEKFPLVVNGVKVCEYRADFCYKDQAGRTIVEDSKGMRTPVYKIKAKLFMACYPDLKISEV